MVVVVSVIGWSGTKNKKKNKKQELWDKANGNKFR